MKEKLQPKESQIIFYNTPKGNIKIDVFFQDENVWLTQKKKYQTEYDRQQPYRQAKKETERLYKKCETCGYVLEDSRATAQMELCPICEKKGKESKLVGVNK